MKLSNLQIKKEDFDLDILEHCVKKSRNIIIVSISYYTLKAAETVEKETIKSFSKIMAEEFYIKLNNNKFKLNRRIKK